METYDESQEPLAHRFIEALSLQASLRVELFRAEVSRDVRALVQKRLIPLGVGIPLVGLGYTITSVAGSLALATLFVSADQLMGPAIGLAIVGTFNLVLGGVITWFATREPSAPAPDPDTIRSVDDE